MRALQHPILLWDTLLISRKISGDFGVCPAAQFIVRPNCFSKTAKIFGKNRPKVTPSINFVMQNIVPYGCKSYKNYLRQILYTHTDFLWKGYPPELFPVEIGGSDVTMWSLLYEKQKFHIFHFLHYLENARGENKETLFFI